MYHKLPPENWLSKSRHFVEEGLRVYGTARGLYEAGSALAGGLRTAYQVAAPVLALAA